MTQDSTSIAHPGWKHVLPPLAVYFVLSVANAVIIPWFELPDEKHHLHYAQFLDKEHGLPDLRLVTPGDSRQSVCAGFNPPLYHLIAACALDPAAPYLSPNLSWHPSGARGFSVPPKGGWETYQGTVSRLWALRGLSILFGSLTVIACFATGMWACGSGPSVAVAMAWFPVALPQFVSMSAAINNEGAAAALAALAVAFAVKASRGGGLEAAATSGTFFGLSLLAKVSGLALVPAMALLLWQGEGRRRRGWGVVALAACVAVAVSAPWFARNWITSGDPLARNAMVSAAVASGVGTFPHTVVGVLRALGLLFCSFYACYGQLAVWLPAALYAIPAGVAALAVCGWLRAGPPLGAPEGSLARDSGVATLCVLAAWLAYNVRVFSPQGRYLYVAMPFLAFLVTRGLARGFPPLLNPRRAHLLGLAFASLQGGYLLLLVRPAYGG